MEGSTFRFVGRPRPLTLKENANVTHSDSRIHRRCSRRFAPAARRRQEAARRRAEPVPPGRQQPRRARRLRRPVGALDKGTLPAATRERIALAVAEINGCSYCLSAHTYLGKNLAKLDDAEIAANRNGASNDPKADAAVRFAAKLVRERGHVSDDDLRAVKAAGYDDAQVIEIVQHVALNTWTNYINEVGADRHRLSRRDRRQAA